MRSASPELRRLARELLALEAATATSAAGSRSAAFHVNDKLRRRLSTLAGVDGFRSLLSRALALAKGEVGWLRAIRVEPDGTLEGLDDALAHLSADEFAEGETVLVARLIGLLTTFIGEGLTLRLVQDVWPEIAARDPNSGTEMDHG